MDAEVVMGEPEDASDDVDQFPGTIDPDEFFAKHAFRIVYQTNNFFLPQINDLIEKGDVLNLRPEYQRRLRRTKNQKSKLIESLLLNIPIPPAFLYESDTARYEVMDGQQRLNAVKECLTGDFALSSLTVLHSLNGIRYSKCPPRIRRALERSSLSAIVLLLESKVDAAPTGLSMTDIRRFIFDRLNTGGTKLNPQEIRNALNPGYFNDLVVEITRDKLFTEGFDIPSYIETNPSDYYESPLRQLPNKLAATAWKRTLEKLARMKLGDGLGREGVFSTAQARFSGIYEFCNGDLSKDIYGDLIHNENNMGHEEINSMCKLSGLSTVCGKTSEITVLKDYFGEFEAGRTHGKLRVAIDDFIDRRNQTAHELRRGHSGTSDQILRVCPRTSCGIG